MSGNKDERIPLPSDAEMRDVLGQLVITIQHMARDRAVGFVQAKRIYDAFGADGASRLAELEALQSRIRELEEKLERYEDDARERDERD